MFDQRKCYGDVTCKQTSSSLFMKYHTYFGIILMLNHSQKIITKCDGIITNCDSLVYYKVRWTVITNCDSFFITKCDTVYYKLRQVLQSAMIITNCDSTKVIWINGVRFFTFSHRRDARLRFSLLTNVFDKQASMFSDSLDLADLTFC